MLKVTLSNGVMKVREFQISNACLQVSFGRFAKQEKTDSDILFDGVLKWHDYIFDVDLHVNDD